MLPLLAALSAAFASPGAARAAQDGREGVPPEARAASDTVASIPSWLRVSGESRVRFDRLDGHFRAGLSGGDRLLLLRSVALAEASRGPVRLALELQDSRAYLADAVTPLGSSLVDPVDVLQAHVGVRLNGSRGGGFIDVKVGRQTVSIGSSRQIERPNFANVIRAYTGLHAEARTGRGDELHALWVVPVRRLPEDRAARADNELELNREAWNRQIWGLHYRRAGLLPGTAPELAGELYVYGLHETDAAEVPTPDRRYVTPGFRLHRTAAPGRWDLDLEGALRFGSRHPGSEPGDARELDVSASMLYLTLGYTLERPWRPRVALQYYRASGDDDPDDDRYGQYERLFGSRRSDLNNTSIHGPLTPANLDALGLRVEVVPSSRLDGRVSWFAASLASKTDAWVVARLRDPSGEAGDFIGHSIDGRVRYRLVPDALTLEVGGSALVFGSFAERVPGGPAGTRTLYGYTQLTFAF